MLSIVEQLTAEQDAAIAKTNEMTTYLSSPEAIMKAGVDIIEDMIQGEVDRLNAAKGIMIGDKFACKMYGETPGYEFQQECIDLWNWQVDLYNNINAWKRTLTTLPTEAEFLAELSKYTYTVVYPEETV